MALPFLSWLKRLASAQPPAYSATPASLRWATAESSEHLIHASPGQTSEWGSLLRHTQSSNDTIPHGTQTPLVRFIRNARKGRPPRRAPARGTREASVTPLPPRANPVKPGSVPHYGQTFHELLIAAQARLKPPGLDPVYDTIREEFDLAYYLLVNRDVAEARTLDPIQHYIATGAKEQRNPTPWFNTRYYLRRNAEVRERRINPFYHYLRWGRDEGRAAGPRAAGDNQFDRFCALLGQEPAAVEAAVTRDSNDIRQRLETGVLGEMVAKATALDPLVAHAWPMALGVQRLPFDPDSKLPHINAIAECQATLQGRGCKAVIAVNRPRWGGGRRMEGHMAHALAETYGADEIVVVYTDERGPDRTARFPRGVRTVNLAKAANALSQSDRQRVLVELIRSLSPTAAFVVNSKLFWDAMGPYGRALSASMDIYACLFCGEQTAHGFWEGYPIRQFYRHFDVLSGLFTDSEALSRDLATRFAIPPALGQKLTVLKAPVDPSIPLASIPDQRRNRRPQVFWSGRFDRQKRLDIVFGLARRMPQIDIRLWGEAVIDRSFKALTPPSNVIFEGIYDNFRDLPLQEADLWLYTSEWDGVPSILLEVGMTGIPIVGALVGGTGEVLKADTSVPVEDIEDLALYENGINAILADPRTARARAARLRDELTTARSLTAYQAALGTALSGSAPVG